jgi:hypothetical protein
MSYTSICPFFSLYHFPKPCYPVIPVIHSDLAVINPLEPVRYRGALSEGGLDYISNEINDYRET